jgi:hypothetical protein
MELMEIAISSVPARQSRITRKSALNPRGDGLHSLTLHNVTYRR